MKRRTLTMVVAISLVALAAGIVGCSSSDNSNVTPGDSGSPIGRNEQGSDGSSMGRDGEGGNSGRNGMMGQPGGSSYSSDGERIFLSGVGTDGGDIARSAPRGSQGSPMMSGGGCASCHGADGRGATIRIMAGTTIETPDITYGALVEDGFTDATIAAAIREGVDEKGDQIDAAMPRWQMSAADLAATIAYLKVLSAQ